ncbi:TPA: PRD domain-containing protein, partial [Listeria monocytogenes]
KFKMIIDEIPLAIIEITDDVVQLAKQNISKTISDVIYISLSDHLYFTTQRMEQNLVIQNPLSWEVKRYYPEEYAVAKEAAKIVEKRLGL